jgi:hypothetical protein
MKTKAKKSFISKKEYQRQLSWLLGKDTGVSSQAIFAVMTGMSISDAWSWSTPLG